MLRRSTRTARAPSRTWTWRSTTASSWCSSARPAAGRRPRCGWSPASRTISEGALRIGDRVVNHVPSRDRDIAMVFQSYALYPHLSRLREHRLRAAAKKMPKDEIDRRVQEAAQRPRPRAVPEAQAARALRRPAPARRDGARDRPPAGGVPDGRAALEPRREAARADARGDRGAAARPRRDDDLRHARPDRGDDDGRPRRGHAQGRAAAGRDAAGALRPARSTCSSAASSAARR